MPHLVTSAMPVALPAVCCMAAFVTQLRVYVCVLIINYLLYIMCFNLMFYVSDVDMKLRVLPSSSSFFLGGGGIFYIYIFFFDHCLLRCRTLIVVLACFVCSVLATPSPTAGLHLLWNASLHPNRNTKQQKCIHPPQTQHSRAHRTSCHSRHNCSALLV